MRTWMWAGVVYAAVAGSGAAEQVYRWAEVYEGRPFPAGVRLDEAGNLVVTGQAGTGRTVALLAIEDPGVDGEVYALSGRIAYADVEGEGYLELWNEFPDGSRYFTRSLSASGPLGKVAGSSAERDFRLPFRRTSAPPPARLELNLVLPGGGTVTLAGPVTLGNVTGRAGAAGPVAWILVAAITGVAVTLGAIRRRRLRAGSAETRRMQAMDA